MTQERDIFSLAEDPATGKNRGVISGPNMTESTLCKPVVLYKDRLLTIDVYALPGQPMYCHIFCPHCQMRRGQNLNEALMVRQEAKPFTVDPKALPVRVAKTLGMDYVTLTHRLGLDSVEKLRGVITFGEPIGCAWESEPDLKRGFGMGICNWRVMIEDNIARDV